MIRFPLQEQGRQATGAQQMKRQRHHGSVTNELTTIQANLTATGTALTGIATGVLALDALITQFQNSPGSLSPSDQAMLDGIQSASTALAAQAQAISTVAPGITSPTPAPAPAAH